MRNTIFSLGLLALMGLSQSANAQTITWNIGYPDTLEVTATLNTVDSTLTISGSGTMDNYTLSNSAPWYSLYHTDIKIVIVGDSVTNIGNSAFWDCSSLMFVSIGNSVTSIGDNAFQYCRNLDTVIIPNSVTSIGQSAFADCSSLMSVSIGNSVTSIGDNTFQYCSSLPSIIIPNSVKTIGAWAFGWCSSLPYIFIPDSVTFIQGSAFEGCSSLKVIDVDSANTDYSSQDSVLFNKNKTTLVCYPGGKTGDYSVPKTVQTIGGSSFANCKGLTSIVIPDSVQTIASSVFWECSNLSTVSIGSSMGSIGYGAFYNCNGLRNVMVYWTDPILMVSVDGSAFQYITPQNVNLHVPCGTEQLYAAAPVWKEFNIIPYKTIFGTVMHQDSTPCKGTVSLYKAKSADGTSYTYVIEQENIPYTTGL